MTHSSSEPGQRVGRRTALRRGAMVVSCLGAVLIGCDGDSAPAVPSPQPRDGTTTPVPTGSAGSGGGSATPANVIRGGTWSVPLGADPVTVHPYRTLSAQAKSIAAYVYNRLYKRITFPGSDGGETVPGPDAAMSAESADGQTWTVRLREGMRLHDAHPVDGRELDAEDVLFSIGLLQAEESPNRFAARNWLNVEAPDPQTLIFTLDAPSPSFREQIADANVLQIIPREADGGFDPALQMIGGGPWALREYRVGSRISFERHPQYYERGEDGAPLPYLDGLERPIIPEYANRIAQFRAGHLEMLQVDNPNDVISLRDDNPEVQWLGQLRQVLSMLYWDHILETNQPWGDDRFRQAVSRALDRDGLTDLGYNALALRDAGLPTHLGWNNIIPTGWGERWWLNPQSVDHGRSGALFQYDPAEARRLLQAAGVDEGFELPYIYTSGYAGAFPPIAEAQAEMLRKVGLAPQTDVQDFSTRYVNKTFVGDFFGMAFGIETPFTDAGSYWGRLFGPAETNHSRVMVPEMTEIDERQRTELDQASRREIFHEGQILNAERMYYVPSQFGAGMSYTAYQPNVRGGIRDTLGFGAGTEEYIYYWLQP